MAPVILRRRQTHAAQIDWSAARMRSGRASVLSRASAAVDPGFAVTRSFDVDVGGAMLGAGRLPNRLLALGGDVIMAHEKCRVLAGQIENGPDRVPQLRALPPGKSAREVARIGIHQRVVHEGGVTHHIG